jgi:hypothetical protein
MKVELNLDTDWTTNEKLVTIFYFKFDTFNWKLKLCFYWSAIKFWQFSSIFGYELHIVMSLIKLNQQYFLTFTH